MEKKLTEEQIEQLFAFTRKKYVHYYDLQVELVDHLASSIEDEMKIDSNLSFEAALQKVYARFGIFGFSKVVGERESTLYKNHRRILFQEIKRFFTLPKVALSFLIFFVSLFGARYINSAILWGMVIIYCLYFSVIEIKFLKRSHKIQKKPLLLTQYATYFSVSRFMLVFYFIKDDWTTNINHYIIASIITTVIIIEYAIIEVNNRLKKKAMELYPEAFMIADA